MAFMTLDVTEVWCNYFGQKSLTDFYENIVFYLEPYLTNTRKLHIDNKDLENLQKRILLHMGLSEFNKIQDLIYINSLSTNAKWDKKSQLSCRILFSGQQVKLTLENLIAKTLELTKSENRRVKFSACELLHTFVMIIVGNDYPRKNQSLHCLNRNLCLEILKLSCDHDDAVRNLIHPLVIQLTHYLSTKSLINHIVSRNFVDLLFEGMLEETSLNLHVYCGICLKEFVKSTSSTETNKITNFMNGLIQRIQNFALHPTNSKRIAAARAFNCLYSFALNSNVSLINIYWLQFLYVFVKCLEHSSHPQIIAAVENIVSTIKEKANVLNGKNKGKRKVPAEFTSETLKGAVIWLLGQCGSDNIKCRYKCMELFENLCPIVPEYKSIQEFFNVHGISFVNDFALKGLDNCECITIENASAFFKTLDFFIWIFNKKIFSPESVLMVDNEDGKNIFFEFYSKFVSIIVNEEIDDIIKGATNSATRSDTLKDLINRIIMKIFRFVQVIVSVKDNESSALLDRLWTKDLCTFVSFFTLYPARIGLFAKTLQGITPKQLENWFLTAVKKLPEKCLVKLQTELLVKRDDFFIKFMEFDEINNENLDITSFQYFVRGITILQKCNVYNYSNKMEITDSLLTNKINIIFEVVETNCSNSCISKEIKSQIKNYVVDVLYFLLLEYNPVVVDCLVRKITPRDDSKHNTSSKSLTVSTCYNSFVEAIKVPIFQFFLIQPADTLQQMEGLLTDGISLNGFFRMIEDLLSFAQQNPSAMSKRLVDELIRNCNKYRELIGNDEQLKDRLLDVYSIAVLLKSSEDISTPDDEVTSDLYLFIMDELKNSQDLQKKISILNRFFVYMVEHSSRIDTDLKTPLFELCDKDSVSWIQKLEDDEVERSRATQCLRCLMDLLSITGASVVLEIIIIYIAGAGKFFKQEKLDQALQAYFASLSSESALVALESIFEVFIIKSLSWDERLDVLQYILLPSLEFAAIPMISNFYNRNIYKISSSLFDTIEETDPHERKQIIVTKIGYFKLTELALSRFHFDSLTVDFNGTDNMTKIFFLPSNSQDEELVRHLNCCILNSLISAIDLQIDCKPLFLIQTIFQRLDVNSWEQIVDCKRHYDMSIPPETFSKRAISIRPKIADENDINKEILDSLLDQYFSPIPVDPDYLRYARNGRQSLTLENDELNDHECMPMLTGLWMYLFNKKALRKPPEEATEKKFEVWMNCLSMGLTPKKDNLTLFILRLFSNAKKIFLPFLSSLFSDIAKALSSYLTNNPINYLVRDMLIMFIESEFIPGEDNENEEEDAQTLVEKLIDEALDENPKIYIYNISLIEALVKAWNSKLKIFRNLEKIININKDLSMCVILMMFRHNVRCEELIKLNFMHKFVREQFFRWRVPMIEKTYETIGFILKFVSNEDRYNFVKNDLVEILVDMANTLPHHTYETGRDCCIRQLYLIFKNCPCIVDYPMLRQFMIPKTVYNDQRKVECIEMLLGVLRSCDVESIDDTLKLLNIVSVLNGRFLLCLDVAFEVVKTVINKLPAEESKPYLLALEQYTNNDTLLRHRKVVYQIFMDAYDKYANEQVSRSEGVEESLNFSRKVLINGISDLSDDIQNFILDFWKNRTNLPSDLMDRLLHLLKMFDLDVAPSYAQFLSSLLLELARESDKDSKVLFTGLSEQDHPMLDYEIATPSLRLYSSKNRIPLYAPALARTLELAIGIQDNDFDNINASMQESCATGNLSRALVDKLTRSNDLCQKSGEDSPKESLSKRYYSEEITESSISVEYYSTVKKEISEQNKSVKVNRTYKLSRVPNVEITQTDVIVTLQDLVLRDRYFAGNLVVPLVCAIVRHFTNTEMYDTLTGSVAEICSRALQIRNDFAPMAMEILHRIGSLNFNATCVADTAKSMNLQLSGILLLERNSITCDQSVYDVKKLINPKIQHNMELVSMYQSIGERDVVQSIFKNWTNSLNSSDLYQGYLAEGTNNWVKVKTIYEGTAEDDPAKDFCEQSMYRSLSELSNWDNLNSKVKASLDVYDIWNHPKKEELLPWMFMSELQMMLEDLQKNIEPETQFFQDALAQVASGNTELRRVFGEELSVYHLCNDRQSIPASLQCLNNCMDYVKEQWIDSDPLVEYSKLQLFAKLGRLSDTDSHIITMSMSDLASSVDNLIEYWNNKFPESRVGLLSWNVRVAARLGIARVAINKLSNVSMNSGVEATLLAASVQERLKISELALEYGNKKLLQKHTKEIENTLNYLNADEGRYLELRQKFEYTAARYKFLCAKDENCAKRKFYYYVDSWALANGVANEEMVDLSLRIKAKVQVAQVVRALSVTMQQDPRYLQLALAEDFVMSSLNVQDPNEIESKLKAHYFELLKGTCNEGSDKERGDNLVVLADYCHQLLMGTYHRTSEVQLEYTNAVLTAMSYGSIKATRFFPDLLKYENYSEDSNLVEFFAEKCRSVPTSMFLHLYKEILSHLGTKFHDIRDKLILPIVERLVNDFPSTIMYKFKEMWSTNAVLRNPELRNLELQKPDTKKKSELRKNLREEQLRTDKIINMYKTVCSEQMDKFFSAVEYLCQPEEYMKFYLSEIIRNGRSTASFIKLLKTLIGKIQMNNDLNLRGSMFQQLLSNYSEQLQEWVTITDLKTLQTIAKNLCVDLRINMQARLKNDKSFNPILLQSYSSFLAEFQFDKHKIEVPGLQNQSYPSVTV
ncbi:DNA-dependent protein kinase catalytic subunit-like [Copidosoma floridanum]|uniref:DNA-dependent protein kinase catalytic subunit-like n=1 Tax=Copidosoma floridanum TaxID=29053 RepID=UPI000C6F81E7|nr:DNA-dependent protein kinase catalytic subunit-like [Copidosoma floridanum]